jgi:hypothetical protein
MDGRGPFGNGLWDGDNQIGGTEDGRHGNRADSFHNIPVKVDNPASVAENPTWLKHSPSARVLMDNGEWSLAQRRPIAPQSGEIVPASPVQRPNRNSAGGQFSHQWAFAAKKARWNTIPPRIKADGERSHDAGYAGAFALRCSQDVQSLYWFTQTDIPWRATSPMRDRSASDSVPWSWGQAFLPVERGMPAKLAPADGLSGKASNIRLAIRDNNQLINGFVNWLIETLKVEFKWW